MQRNAHTDWDFPFERPGRAPKTERSRLPPRSAYRWPYRRIDDGEILPARGTPSPVSLSDFKHALRAACDCDDIGVISLDDPAIAHELQEIRYVYPHTRSLVCLIAEENKPSMQSRYLPTANHELYTTEERLFEIGRRAIAYMRTLGGSGLTTTIGWPQEVSVRWADKIWPVSHKIVAQAAGLGVIGLSRNFLHKKFGAYCLIDTVLTDLEFAEFDHPVEWNPCVECNLCVASCPTDAIRADGDFDFFACYNHTYRDSIPGFLDLVRDLAESTPRRFEKRWTDTEIAALWQSLAFRVEYRCFNCVATCPAEIHDQFHGSRETRRTYLDETLKPLTRTRREGEQQFVIDTPSARERYGIPPGEWRTRLDPDQPASKTVRLVDLRRIRTQDVDAMMRNMPQYFRDQEAGELAFTAQLDFSAPGQGQWVMTVDHGRCRVEPGTTSSADVTVRCSGKTFHGIQYGSVNPTLALLTGRIRLSGNRRLFLNFPRLFGFAPGSSVAHRLWYLLRRALRHRPAATKGSAA
jgi:epoxyqueuosine reductase QueG/putative sterol carrier protein